MYRPRVILIENAGQLVGLVTKKDVLKAVHRKQYRTRGLLHANERDVPSNDHVTEQTPRYELASLVENRFMHNQLPDESIELA